MLTPLLTHAPSGLLDNLKVLVYGQRMPLRGAANVSVRDAQTLLVTAFDPSVSSEMPAALLLVLLKLSQLSAAYVQTVPAIEKAITSSSLNLNPRTDGQELVVPVPRYSSWVFSELCLHTAQGQSTDQ